MFAKHWVKVKEQTAKYYEGATKATGEVYKNVTAKHDKYKSLMEMVSDYNYPIEKYFYTTKDNYINCLFRISGPKGSKPQGKTNKPVVLYQHGFLDAGATICCDGPNSLAFYFADQGFDVWLNNTRGNRFSRHHTYLDPDSNPKFWDFSFQDFADYDQPALFEFVLDKTGVENLTYIGHSQGTQQMFAALCENLDFFRPKINLCIMLAPVTRVDRMTCGTAHKLKESENLFKFLEGQGPELMSTPQVDGKLMGGLLWATGIANYSLGMISDEDPSLISKNGVETYFGHYPSGTSFRNLTHFRQIINSGKFQKYDFGPEENLKRYNNFEPPEYDLKAIKDVPIALFCGLKDRLASQGDYQWVKEQLGESVVYYKEFQIGHMGFLLPPTYEHFYEMMALSKAYNSYYKPQIE